MKTRFQISTTIGSSALTKDEASRSPIRSKCISEHGPQGPTSPISQKLSFIPKGNICEDGSLKQFIFNSKFYLKAKTRYLAKFAGTHRLVEVHFSCLHRSKWHKAVQLEYLSVLSKIPKPSCRLLSIKTPYKIKVRLCYAPLFQICAIRTRRIIIQILLGWLNLHSEWWTFGEHDWANK